jgi:hypothetical protein
VAYLNDGNPSASEDSWDGSPKDADLWGITWSRPYNLDRVVYTTGAMFSNGGWFASGLTVCVPKTSIPSCDLLIFVDQTPE